MSDLHAAPSDPPDAATQAIQAAPAAGPVAPSDMGQAMLTFGQRLTAIESVLGMVLPAVNEAGAVAGAFVPQAAPVLERLPAIEAAVEGVLAALAHAFGGKVENLPPPGTSIAPAPGPTG